MLCLFCFNFIHFCHRKHNPRHKHNGVLTRLLFEMWFGHRKNVARMPFLTVCSSACNLNRLWESILFAWHYVKKSIASVMMMWCGHWWVMSVADVWRIIGAIKRQDGRSASVLIGMDCLSVCCWSPTRRFSRGMFLNDTARRKAVQSDHLQRKYFCCRLLPSFLVGWSALPSARLTPPPPSLDILLPPSFSRRAIVLQQRTLAPKTALQSDPSQRIQVWHTSISF